MNTSTSERLLLSRFRAAELSIGLSSLDALVRGGHLHTVKVSRRRLFAKSELERFANSATKQ